MPTRTEQVHTLMATVEFIANNANHEDSFSYFSREVVIGDLHLMFVMVAYKLDNAIVLRGSLCKHDKYAESIFDSRLYLKDSIEMRILRGSELHSDSVRDAFNHRENELKFAMFDDALNMAEEFARSLQPYDILLHGSAE